MIKIQNLCKMKTPALRPFLRTQLERHEYQVIGGDNYIFAQGRIPICLVAHIDTVHKNPPYNVFYDQKQRVMWSPTGLGADDRAGVWAILRILSKGYRPSVLFTDLEEHGCIGASEAAKKVNPVGLKYVIEIDRRGYEDAVFYDEDNPQFKKYVESFGFKEDYGSYTDICELMGPWGVACVNVSAGYYGEHTTSEHLYLDDLLQTCDRVMQMLSDSPNAPEFKHIELPRAKQYTHWLSRWGKDTDTGTYSGTGNEGGKSWMYDKESNTWVSEDDPMDIMVQCGWCGAWMYPEEQYKYNDEGEDMTMCSDCATYIKSQPSEADKVRKWQPEEATVPGQDGLFKNK